MKVCNLVQLGRPMAASWPTAPIVRASSAFGFNSLARVPPLKLLRVLGINGSQAGRPTGSTLPTVLRRAGAACLSYQPSEVTDSKEKSPRSDIVLSGLLMARWFCFKLRRKKVECYEIASTLLASTEHHRVRF